MPLPGLIVPPGFFSEGALPLALAKRAQAANAQSATIVIPATCQQGDLILFVVRYTREDSTVVGTPTVPPGFTLLFSQTNTSGSDACRLSVCYKIAGPADALATLTGRAIDDITSKQVIVFATGGARAAVHGSEFGRGAAAWTGTVSASALAAPVLAIAALAGISAGDTLTLASANETITANDGTRPTRLAYCIMNSSPANVSASAAPVTSVNRALLGGFIRITS